MANFDLQSQIATAVGVIRQRTALEPDVGIILGTGLGGLARDIAVETTIEYPDIPGFPSSTVESHVGRLLFGALGGKRVVAMQGRFHYYEGYDMAQITFPVRVMKSLGARGLLVSNACGGLNPHYAPGDIMVITDHINMLGTNPLIGLNEDSLGPRFPDMSEPYTHALIALARDIAMENRIPLQQGVYVAWPGPCLETRAEYRMLRTLGADVVGMSTVPEVIAAVHMGMQVLGLSVVTDSCFPDALEPVDISKIIAIAEKAEPKLTLLMKRVVERANW